MLQNSTVAIRLKRADGRQPASKRPILPSPEGDRAGGNPGIRSRRMDSLGSPRGIYGVIAVAEPTKTRNGPTKSQEPPSEPAVPRFDAATFLTSVAAGRSTRKYKSKKTIFQQGDPADAV